MNFDRRPLIDHHPAITTITPATERAKRRFLRGAWVVATILFLLSVYNFVDEIERYADRRAQQVERPK